MLADTSLHRKEKQPSLDIVIPMFNEQEVVDVLVKRLESVFNEAQRKKYGLAKVRYIFVNDGSKDNTVELLKKQVWVENPATLICFSRNFGHQAAVSAGVIAADADITAIIDADLQDPPEMILEMLGLWRQGYDVVYGQRRKRQEGLIKNTCYKLFYRIYRWMSPVEVALDSGDFCIMDKRVVLALNSLPEKLRFLRGLRSWVGFSQVGFEYDRTRRELGSTKYSFRKLYQLATDGITSLSIMPLKVSQFFALLFLCASFIFFMMVHLNLTHQSSMDQLMMLTFANSLSNSLILLCLYILGAYIGRMYFETKNRPIYIIREVVDFPIKS